MSNKEKNKVIPNRLKPEVFDALKRVVGERWISQQRSVIETYSKFSIDGQSFLRKYAKDPHAIPACIILPVTTEEVQEIVSSLAEALFKHEDFEKCSGGEAACRFPLFVSFI